MRKLVKGKIPRWMLDKFNEDDLVQSVWVDILKIGMGELFDGKDWDGIGKTLNVIVSGNLLDTYRYWFTGKRNLKKNVPLLEDLDFLIDDCPLEKLLVAEFTTKVQTAIALLTTDQAEVVTAQLIAGLKPKQVRERLGKTRKAVEALSLRGRKILRTLLTQIDA